MQTGARLEDRNRTTGLRPDKVKKTNSQYSFSEVPMKTQNLMWYRKVLMALAMLVFAGTAAVAEVPEAPVDVYATCRPDGQGGRMIDVVWMNGFNGGRHHNVDGY